MRVLGVDCGTEYTGYGSSNSVPTTRWFVLLVAPSSFRRANRFPGGWRRFSNALGAIIRNTGLTTWPSKIMFYALNVKSALKLGQVRGVAMLAASSAGLEVTEYSPLSIKSAVVGYGGQRTTGPAHGHAFA